MGNDFLARTKAILSRTILILSWTKYILSGQMDEAIVSLAQYRFSILPIHSKIKKHRKALNRGI